MLCPFGHSWTPSLMPVPQLIQEICTLRFPSVGFHGDDDRFRRWLGDGLRLLPVRFPTGSLRTVRAVVEAVVGGHLRPQLTFLLIVLLHATAAHLDPGVAGQPSLLEVRLVNIKVAHGGVAALGFNAGREDGGSGRRLWGRDILCRLLPLCYRILQNSQRVRGGEQMQGRGGRRRGRSPGDSRSGYILRCWTGGRCVTDIITTAAGRITRLVGFVADCDHRVVAVAVQGGGDRKLRLYNSCGLAAIADRRRRCRLGVSYDCRYAAAPRLADGGCGGVACVRLIRELSGRWGGATGR